MSKERVIIGLDASSSEIGICIWSLDKSKILQLTHKTLGEKESVVLKGDKFKQLMTDLSQEYDIVQVGIEEAFVAMFNILGLFIIKNNVYIIRNNRPDFSPSQIRGDNYG